MLALIVGDKLLSTNPAMNVGAPNPFYISIPIPNPTNLYIVGIKLLSTNPRCECRFAVPRCFALADLKRRSAWLYLSECWVK